jgi:SPP1 gp7 family putative phage head morphogenesis protein
MMAQLRNLIFKPKQTEKPKVKMGDVAWAESQLYTGNFPKYNPDDLIGRKGFKIYRNMLLDEQVKAVVKFKRDAITSRDFVFQLDDDRLSESEADKRIATYDAMIDNMAGSFNDGLNYVMSAMYQGFSITEKMYKVFDHDAKPYVGIYRLNPKPFETFKFDVDDFGNVKKAIQEMDGQEQKINLDKFIYFIHNPEFDQHYGQSDLREAYRSWYSKDVIIRLYNQFLERFAGGFVVARPTDGMTLAQGSKEFNAIKAAIDNIRQQTSILFPAKMELEMHQPATTDQFEKAIVMHDLQIAKALLVPNLLGISHQGETGSYAQSSTQLEAFLWTLDADCKRLKDSLNEQLFLKLNEINFADGIGPTIHFKPVSEQKKHEVIGIWTSLIQGGAAEPSDTDEAHLRELLDFPEKGTPRPLPTEVAEPAAPAKDKKIDDTKAKKVIKETVIGSPSGEIEANISFNRARQRVAFKVIERKVAALESKFRERLEDRLDNMLFNLLDTLDKENFLLKDFSKLDFASADKLKARRVVDSLLKQSWKLGEKFSRDELSSAAGELFTADYKRISDEAADFLKASGFRMLGHLSVAMREEVHQTLIDGLKYSWSFRKILRKIYDKMVRKGFFSLRKAARRTNRTEREIFDEIFPNKDFDDLQDFNPDFELETHRIETAVRTNAFEALNEARYAMFTDPALDGFVVALEYSAVMDARTTEVCQHMDDRVYSVSQWDTFFEDWKPPNHFNCRSVLVPVTRIDTEVRGRDAPDGDRWSPAPTIKPMKGFGDPDG